MTLERIAVELDEAKALVDLGRQMSACAKLDRLGAVLARELGSLLPVQDRISIVLLEPDGEWLTIHRIHPPPEPGAALPRLRVEGTPVGRVVREGVGRVVADVRADPNITFGHVSHDGIRSTVSVPLRIDGRVVGAMNAGSRLVGACTDDMLERMERVAAVVGPAFYSVAQARDGKPRSRELVGTSPAFRSMLAVARRAAQTDADVLLTGETGVGKTALARAVHDWSARRDAPFVTVQLADLAPSLVESELFGYERGAFTGASAVRIGRFETAEGGTILLDEIGETPLAIQAKLLRIIQDRCFERVGGSRTIEANVRIIAATNIDLAGGGGAPRIPRGPVLPAQRVVPLHVPPLRDRDTDIELLAESILARIQPATGRARSLAPAARARLLAHRWPGNVRELESVLRRAAILEDTDELALDELGAPPAISMAAEPQSWVTLHEHERAYI